MAAVEFCRYASSEDLLVLVLWLLSLDTLVERCRDPNVSNYGWPEYFRLLVMLSWTIFGIHHRWWLLQLHATRVPGIFNQITSSRIILLSFLEFSWGIQKCLGFSLQSLCSSALSPQVRSKAGRIFLSPFCLVKTTWLPSRWASPSTIFTCCSISFIRCQNQVH